MRSKIVAFALAALLVAALAPTADAASRIPRVKIPRGPLPRQTQRFVDREVIVRFEPGSSAVVRGAAHRALAARVVQKLLLPDTYLVRLPQGIGVRAAAAGYEKLPGVSYASPNFSRYLMADPNDARFTEMWGLDNTGQNTPASVPPVPPVIGADIDAKAAWDGPTASPGMGTGTSDTVVAVIDDGVSINHPDLDGNIFHNAGDPTVDSRDQDGNGLRDDTTGWDFIDFDRNVIGPDTHGTHVAGTIGAEGNNGVGVTGVNWDVSILPIRIFDDTGTTSLAAVVNAYVYSGMMGADVANGSFGGPGRTQLEVDALRASKDTLFVVASGNGGLDGVGDDNDARPTFPCNYTERNVMCVGATNSADRLTSFSNFGDRSVHIVAPGEAILSTSRHAFPAQHNFETTPPPGWTLGSPWNSGAGGFVGLGKSLQDSPGGADYGVNQNTSATLPINLSGLTGCLLEYATSFELQAGDFVHVESSGDGAAWTTHRSYTGSDIGFDQIGLQSHQGDATAFIRFRLQTNGDVVDDGIYVDEFAVSCNSASGTDGGYQFLQGTSMATPHVAGAAALIFESQPNANPFSVRRALMAAADALPVVGDVAKIFPGSGRLNADAFLDEDATPLAIPTVGGTSLKSAFQKKTSVAMNLSSSSAVGYRLWDERTRFNSLTPASLFYSPSGSSVTAPAASGFTHCFAAASRKAGGNESNFSNQRCTAVPVNNTDAKHSTGWAKKRGSGHFLNTFSQTKKKGATLSLSGAIFHRIALVATKCSDCGKVGLFFGKQRSPFRTVSLGSRRTKKRQVIPLFVKPGLFKSKVVIKVLTSGKPVKIEGIGISQV